VTAVLFQITFGASFCTIKKIMLFAECSRDNPVQLYFVPLSVVTIIIETAFFVRDKAKTLFFVMVQFGTKFKQYRF